MSDSGLVRASFACTFFGHRNVQTGQKYLEHVLSQGKQYLQCAVHSPANCRPCESWLRTTPVRACVAHCSARPNAGTAQGRVGHFVFCHLANAHSDGSRSRTSENIHAHLRTVRTQLIGKWNLASGCQKATPEADF